MAKSHAVEKLEKQFQDLHKKISKARSNYVAAHQKEIDGARQRFKNLQSQFNKAATQVGATAARVKKSSSKAANNQLQKARAASLLLGDSLKEAKRILVTAESRLQSVKPFDRKLAARAKLLEQFDKEWEKSARNEALARKMHAKVLQDQRQAAAKKRASKPGSARKSSAQKGSVQKSSAQKGSAKNGTVKKTAAGIRPLAAIPAKKRATNKSVAKKPAVKKPAVTKPGPNPNMAKPAFSAQEKVNPVTDNQGKN